MAVRLFSMGEKLDSSKRSYDKIERTEIKFNFGYTD